MKYIEGFRNPKAARKLAGRVRELGAALEAKGRSAHIMEVCGTHTMAIARYGIRDILPDNIDLISGPGCPVCVTDGGYIDAAIRLAESGPTVVTFGDMLQVPGSDRSLAQCRADGGKVEVCYGPATALELARKHPDQKIVFLAIGFETTICPGIAIVDQAVRQDIGNLSLLTAFKLVPPALLALGADPELSIDAFLCPAHVSAIIGADAYEPFTGPNGVPCVVAGFEPLDVLLGLAGILEQLLAGEARVDNQYSRVVRPEGNRKAQALMASYLEPVDAAWRGIGVIPGSGLGLREEFAAFDAEKKHGVPVTPGREPPGCRCGDVIKGKLKPPDCPIFATGCTPDKPIGPCMVSAEGSCAAYFKYSRMDS
jgi:hydrogenase expression/formation protein HypD